MPIGISPVVLSFGPLSVRWFVLLAMVGLAVAVWLSLRELDHRRLGRKLALDVLAWGLPVGLLSARLVYVTGYWDFYLTNASEVWRLNVDGLSLWGGLLGGGLVVAARLRRDPLKRRRILDAVAPGVLLGIAIGRVGAFLEGAGQGLPSTLPWATQYTSPLAATPDFGVPRHPAQLYEALLAVSVFVVLQRIPERGPPAGSRVAALLVLFGLGRLGLGMLRLDPAFLFGLQIEQLIAVGAVLYGASFGVWPLVGQRLGRRALATAEPHRAAAAEDSLAA